MPPTPYHGRGSRLSTTDLIVVVGGLLLLLGGWALQRAHDARLEPATAAGVALAYPAAWLQLPAMEPALAQWTDDSGFGATLTLYASPAGAEAPIDALALGGGNPAPTRSAYSPLRSEPATVGGVSAVRSDYAYAQVAVAASSPPLVVLGRQVAWVEDGQLYQLALEAPERDWNRVEPLFAPLAAAVRPAEGGA